MSRSIVVVGAGLAALRAVEQLRAAGWSEPITVLGTEAHLPYNRPPLTKAALQGGVDPAALAFRRRPSTEDVEWRLGTTVTSADLDARTVTLADGSTLAFDGLVAASGVSSRRLDLARRCHWRHAIRTAEDAHALHQQLKPGRPGGRRRCGVHRLRGRRSAVALGCAVTVVEPFPVPLERQVGPVVGEEIRRRHEEHGVAFHLGRVVVAVEGDPAEGPPRSSWTTARGSRPTSSSRRSARSPTPAGWRARGWTSATASCATSTCTRCGRRPGAATSWPSATWPASPSRCPASLHRIEHWTMPTDMAGHAARSLLAGIEGAAPRGRRSSRCRRSGATSTGSASSPSGCPRSASTTSGCWRATCPPRPSSATTGTACWSAWCCSAWASRW